MCHPRGGCQRASGDGHRLSRRWMGGWSTGIVVIGFHNKYHKQYALRRRLLDRVVLKQFNELRLLARTRLDWHNIRIFDRGERVLPNNAIALALNKIFEHFLELRPIV